MVLATLTIAAIAYGGVSVATHRTAARIPAATPTAASPASPTLAPPSPAPTPTIAPVARLIVRDAYALDSSRAWILLTDCIQPMAGQCHYSVSSTADGGRTWSPEVQVGPMFGLPADGNAPTSVRFVNRLDGFVSGAEEAYVTHDAGKSWHASGLPAAVFDGFAVEGGTAWAVTNPCGKGINCRWEVRSSPDGGRTWTDSHALPSGFSPFEEVAFRSGLLISSVPFGDLEITTDGGSTWRSVKAPCTGDLFRGYVASSDGVELWEACMGHPGDTGDSAAKTLFSSENGGKSWSVKGGTGAGAVVPDPGVTVVLVSNRPHTAFAGTDRAPMSVTHDGGATWSRLGFGFVFTALMFSTPQAGWALDPDSNLWTTADGGAHWSQMGTYKPPD
jgi:photosystem II stability/assembly factor-like uncharacterized protein